ncbi:MAG: right-handed parallel beta-helix repeat-containing protein [Armatimonadetes bacterium]|nr:right-handed parallel beta-helix repeat-containing protein [Armatimonadota bacterium]
MRYVFVATLLLALAGSGWLSPGAQALPTIDGTLSSGEWDGYYLGTSVTGWQGGMSVEVYGFAQDGYLYTAYKADTSQPGWAVSESLNINANFYFKTPQSAVWPGVGYTICEMDSLTLQQTNGIDWAPMGTLSENGIVYGYKNKYLGEPDDNVAELKIPLTLLTYAGNDGQVRLSGQYWQYDFATPFDVSIPLPPPSVIYVDDDYTPATPGWGYDHFATIQDAIDAAVSTTILVSPGTYNEAVTVNKSGLTITGDTGDSSPGPGADAPILDGTGLSGQAGFLLTAGVSDIVIEGFVVQNYGPDWDTNADGVIAWSSTPINNVTVRDNEFTGLGWNAVLVGNEGQAAHSGWTVERNVVEDYQAYGIELTNCSSSSISDNVVTGRATSLTGILLACYDYPGGSQYDISVSGLLVQGNVVSGVLGGDVLGRGIRVFAWDGDGENTVSMDDIDILSNTVSGCEEGILVWAYEATPSAVITNVSVNQNNLVGNTVNGLNNRTVPLLDGENNWWGLTNSPGPVGPGSGDRVTTNVDYDPWLTKAAGDNALYLEITPDSVYVQPGETVTVDLKQANMTVGAAGYQAFLNFDTGMLSSPTATWAAGTPYEQAILNNITGGDVDLAAGTVTSGGTSADADLVRLQFTAGSTEGLTQIVFRSHDPVTQFTDTLGNGVNPTTVDSSNVYIDGTDPTDVTISADPASWTDANSVDLTFSATDALSGIDHYELQVDAGTYSAAASPYALDVSGLADGTHTVTVKAIDRAGNEATASTTIYLDKTNPGINIAHATQNSNELLVSLGSTTNAIQGQVDIQVTASDATSPLTGPPTVTVTKGASSLVVTYDGESPTGTFNYHVTVGPDTENGTWNIDASVSDSAGNISADTDTFNVNKSQAVVNLRLAGVNAASVTRWIKFVIGGDGGTVPPVTITRQVTFTNGVGTTTFTDLSNDGRWTSISAKDEQHTLNSTIALIDIGEIQYAASFTGTGTSTGRVQSIDVVVGTSGSWKGSQVLLTSIELNGTTYPIGDASISYGTIGTGATATLVGSDVELYTPDGGAGSAYVRLSIPGGIALNAISSLKYTAKITAVGTSTWTPEVVLNIDADGDSSITGTGIEWMHSGHSAAVLGGDNFLSGDGTPVSVVDSDYVTRNALGGGYFYWSAGDDRTGFGDFWANFTDVIAQWLPRHGIDVAGALIGGDGTNDNLIDILDFGVFAGQYGTTPSPTSTWPTRNANFDNAGDVGTADFTFIQTGFLSSGDSEPGNAESSSAVGRASISVKELAQIIGMKDAKRADVNKDGTVDATDIALFLSNTKHKNK